MPPQPTWDEISAWSSNKLAEYLRDRGMKVAAALVWLENSPRASGQRLAAWVRATRGFSIEGLREYCDEVYRENTDKFRSFGLYAGIHSSIPMKELGELRALGVEVGGQRALGVEVGGQKELLTTQQMEDDDGSLMEGLRRSSSPSSIADSEVSNSSIEETQPPGEEEQSSDEEVKEEEEVQVKVEVNEGRRSIGGSGGSQKKRGAKRMSHTEAAAASPKRRRSSTVSTKAPVRRSARAKSSPASGRRCSSGRRASTASHKVFLLSGITSTVEHTLSGLCNRLGSAKIEELDRCIERGVTPKLTHIIVPDKNPVVTLKVLYGLCTPVCNIVHEGWVADCRIASQWVPIDEYVVKEWAERPRWTPGRDGPLEKVRIHFSGKMKSMEMMDHYYNLIRLCGGIVDKESPRGARVVVVGVKHKLPDRLLFDLKHGVVPTPALVTEEWLMQCLKTQSFIDEFDKYLPCGIFKSVPNEWHD